MKSLAIMATIFLVTIISIASVKHVKGMPLDIAYNMCVIFVHLSIQVCDSLTSVLQRMLLAQTISYL